MKSQAIVIDSSGNRIAFVMADEYVLKKGESLITKDLSTALEMVSPRWIDERWGETATPEALEELANPEILPSRLDRIEDKLNQTQRALIDIILMKE